MSALPDIAECDVINTPLGDLIAAIDAAGVLTHLVFPRERDSRRVARAAQAVFVARRRPGPGTRALRAALAAYFGGESARFDIPFAPRGTSMQEEVWQCLLTIPVGETRSYGQLAQTIARPRAPRAVGAANASNPISIIVPCHRLIGSNGTLTGYAGGLQAKRWLIEHEHRCFGG